MLLRWFELRVIAWVVIQCSIAAVSATSSYDAFSDAIPSGDVGSLYSSYFVNLGSMLPCTLTGQVMLSPVTGRPVTNVVGCSPMYDANFFSALYPLTIQIANRALDGICRSGSPLSVNGTQVLWDLWGDIPPPHDPAQGIFLVLSSTEQMNTLYNLSCILSCVEAWNRFGSNRITGIMMDAQTVSLFGAPLTTSADVATNHLLWVSHSVALLLFETLANDAARVEFQQVVQRAYFNIDAHQASVGSGSSVVAAQYIGTMYASTSTNASSCLAESTCLPLGGISVVGTTAVSSWATDSDNNRFVKQTPPGSVAIVVSSTGLGLFHDAIPAADASASGIVAALLALDALTREFGTELTQNTSAPQLYGVFLVGEEYNRTGSSRLVDEMANFVCQRFPADPASSFDCAFPIYRSLNFTSVNVSNIHHFIELEQVGFNASIKGVNSLYYHVQQTFNNTVLQEEANRLLFRQGIVPSSSGELPTNSPLRSFLESNKQRASYTLISRYDVDYSNPFLFTPSDIADHLTLEAVVEAAESLAAVVGHLLGGPTASPVVVNATLAAELWFCFTENFNCPSLRANGMSGSILRPNYYTSVFQYDIAVQPYQVLIQTQLARSDLRAFRVHALSIAAMYRDTPAVSFEYEPSSGTVWVESNWNPVGCRLVVLETSVGEYGLLTVAIFLNVCVVIALRIRYFA
jgi:hypothetical protein